MDREPKMGPPVPGLRGALWCRNPEEGGGGTREKELRGRGYVLHFGIHTDMIIRFEYLKNCFRLKFHCHSLNPLTCFIRFIVRRRTIILLARYKRRIAYVGKQTTPDTTFD